MRKLGLLNLNVSAGHGCALRSGTHERKRGHSTQVATCLAGVLLAGLAAACSEPEGQSRNSFNGGLGNTGSGTGGGQGDASGGSAATVGNMQTNTPVINIGDNIVDQPSSDGEKCNPRLIGVVRDFDSSHQDFQSFSGQGITEGLVESQLGPDGVPVYKPRAPNEVGADPRLQSRSLA